MAENYVLLETIALTQSASSVTLNNIPQSGYTDLKLVISARQGAENAFDLTFNGSTSSYSVIRLQGDGSSTSSNTASGHTAAIRVIGIAPSGNTANVFSNSEFHIPNYTSSNYKPVSYEGFNENNATESYINVASGVWSNTSAITSITITPRAGSLEAYSTFSLYGLAALGTTPTVAPKATGGNIVATDGTYWYHAFLSSGIFTPQAPLSCDYLVVAGGGGGGSNAGGGGGAGGLRLATAQNLSASSYTVIVGAGGMYGATDSSTTATSGGNSSINSYSATGGARGSMNGFNGDSGGSGGGASGSGYVGGSGNAGSYSPVEGFAGGNGVSLAGGGGGGSGAAGSNGSGSTTAGAGGAGTNSYNSTTFTDWLTATTTGVSGYLAGGGGGGSEGGTKGNGGSGGGGAGGQSNANGTAGTINTGSGGGGGSNGSTVYGGLGASGLVIIRYAIA